MKTISIIIIAIVISIAICTQINNKNKYLKSSSSLSLKEATNLAGCTADQIKAFTAFVPISDAALPFVLYNIKDNKYSYIKKDFLFVVELTGPTDYTKFRTAEYYSYSAEASSEDKIFNVAGKMTKHLVFDEAGTKLSDKSIFYKATDSTAPTYEIQLTQNTNTAATPVTSIQSECTYKDYTTEALKPILSTIEPFLLSDFVSPYLISTQRDNVLTIEDISDKRMTKVNDKKYNTFYMKDTKMCSISYDGVSIYTVYSSEYNAAADITLTPDGTTKIAAIPEGTKTKYLSYTLECKGDDGSKECTKLSDSTIINMEYTMVISKTAPKPVYVFKNKINFGSSSSTDKLSMEPAAIEEIAKTWDGCVIGIEKVNNIGIYKYNIIILFIISLLYIL